MSKLLSKARRKQTSLNKMTNSNTKKNTGEENYTNPLKLGVVHSTTRSWSSSILKKGQFSQPDSRNCMHDQLEIERKHSQGQPKLLENRRLKLT